MSFGYVAQYLWYMSDIIICRLDGKEVLVKHLARHLKLYHRKDYREYIGENIEDFQSVGWNLCSICRNPVKGKACPGECLRQHYSDARIGRARGPMTDETKRKLSDDRKRKYANGWEPRVGKLHSEKSKKKISKSQIKRLSDPTHHPFYGKHHSQESKQKISKTRIEHGVAAGEKNGMYGKTHTPEAIRKIFSHRKMNGLEKIVADKLDEAGIPYHFQYFIVENGICKSYDFKIKGKPLIIEVDGDFWHGNSRQPNHYDKVDCVRKNDKIKDEIAKKRGISVIRLWESDIRKDPSIVLKYMV